MCYSSDWRLRKFPLTLFIRNHPRVNVRGIVLTFNVKFLNGTYAARPIEWETSRFNTVTLLILTIASNLLLQGTGASNYIYLVTH